jgi:hypothetical protein
MQKTEIEVVKDKLMKASYLLGLAYGGIDCIYHMHEETDALVDEALYSLRAKLEEGINEIYYGKNEEYELCRLLGQMEQLMQEKLKLDKIILDKLIQVQTENPQDPTQYCQVSGVKLDSNRRNK